MWLSEVLSEVDGVAVHAVNAVAAAVHAVNDVSATVNAVAACVTCVKICCIW